MKLAAVLFTVVVALGACSSSDDDKQSSALQASDGLLQYIPADTPFVFAAPEPMPQDVLDKLEPHIDAILAAYQNILTIAIEDIPNAENDDSENAAQMARLATIGGEFVELLGSGGLGDAGLSLKSRSAIYGIGLLPVMRFELTDTAAFEALIARFEEKSGEAMSVANIGEQTYRYVGDDDAHLVIAIIDKYLVATVVPAALSTEQLEKVLGLTLPTRNIGTAGVLDSLASEYGYTPHTLGFIDIERVVATFLDEQSGVNAELLKLMDYDGSVLTDVCRKEIREMSGVIPRMVTGYTEVSVDRFNSRLVFELRNDIATNLATLAAVVPGLGSDHGGLFSFGMSLDVLAARDFYAARLDALEADPYECELFAELQGGVAQGRAVLNQPVPPLAYGFKGFLAVIDDIGDFDFASQRPPEKIDMRLLVAIDNAEALLAMGTMFSPELAALNLQPDGKPVEMAMPQLAGRTDSLSIAMTDNLLGVAVGADAKDGLGELLTADAIEPPPSFSMTMDASSYYQLMGEIMMTPNEGTDESAEMSPEIAQALGTMMNEFGKLLDRISVDIVLTDRGVEIQSNVELVD